ncbi:polysaccharide pyruvyl transferase family protein [Paragemmobacter straminiformis]|uniref:Polysaccharide pyruvyl transferase family protein n=1 Tax=Paragemmobacter straminiformis TaxID=2045119 RepID=A0A842I7S7_9RHOB|nr:polysaccharide pyruvyl transferase family protein [Gemmobacter straminiformis]MBC2835453.1 polysaccharide pyruvyl transferase family protein [Gemmobacter straminiformis]
MSANPVPVEKRALVIGFLSTVGDIEVLSQVESRLRQRGLAYDVAPFVERVRAANSAWVDARRVDPARYTHLIVVCGPFSEFLMRQQRDIYARFANCVWIGVNLSMIDPTDRFDPFDALLERDSAKGAKPDLSLLEPVARVPVVGLCLAGRQPEYGKRQRHGLAESRLRALAQRHGAAVLDLDTKWPAWRNRQGTATPAQFESLLARVDVLLTTRLHGTVLALKNAVPVIAIDAIAGGDKVTQQARALGWPEVFDAETVSDAALDAALSRCLSPGAKAEARAAAEAAMRQLDGFDAAFAAAFEAQAGKRSAALGSPLSNEIRRRWILYRQGRKSRKGLE